MNPVVTENHMACFEPLLPSDSGAANMVMHGLRAMAAHVEQSPTPVCINKETLDGIIAEIDTRLSQQLDAILHHPKFQALESAWRSIAFLMERSDPSQNIRVAVLDVSKNEIAEDFDDSGSMETSFLYRTVYADAYGTYGGEPFAALCTTFGFTPSYGDMRLLGQCARVARAAHAPFLTNADPRFLGVNDLAEFDTDTDLEALFQGPEYASWRAFRENDDTRYVGLCLPRFRLREPYSPHSPKKQTITYWESFRKPEENLWGSASMALAACLTRSFSMYRWCLHIIGPHAGGAVEQLPVPSVLDSATLEPICPIEWSLTDRREFVLSEAGFIPMTAKQNSASACFFSATSAHKPEMFANTPEGNAASMNARLGAQLPYMFIISRLAHYLKVLQREEIGRWKERSDIERELNVWLKQYVADMENPTPSVRARRPLRAAQVHVEDIADEPGWYRCHLQVQPHMKYMGASFSLSLVGRLERD